MLSDEEKQVVDYLIFHKYENSSKKEDMIDKIIEIIEKQSKEIEELKQNIHLKEVYVLKTNDYIKGTNVEEELCNKKWKDKIKAEIEESELLIDNSQGCMSDEDLYKEYGKIEFGQSLLEKE